jgi:Flp pilus assembly protein TadG
MLFFTISLLVTAGLVIDGGRAMAGRQRAANTAEQAARLGADQLDQDGLRAGSGTPVNAAAAQTAARAFVSAAGPNMTGSVTVTGDTVSVHVTHTMRTTLLGIIGINKFTQSARADARPVRGVLSEGS